MRALARLNRFNQRHPWSHNDRLATWVDRQVAGAGAKDVLDIGCGTGNLIDQLRRHSHATGLEPDPTTAEIAVQRFAHDPAVTIQRATFDDRDQERRWDAIAMVAVLHHLPLEPTLHELRSALRPGGRLVVVGCYREDGVKDLAVGLLSALANPIIGLIKHPARARVRPKNMCAPTAPARETLAEIATVARRELPGATIRRRMFWRYTLVYEAP